MDLKLDICLSDIDRSKIKVSDKDGKKYLTVYCIENRDGVNLWGNTHYLSTGKGADGKTNYIGSAKPVERPDVQTNENDPF